MPNIEAKTYEDLKNNESVQLDNNLKTLLKELDEIKNNDKIKWIFSDISEWQTVERTLNQNLLDSLDKLDIEIIQILVNEVKNLISDTNLQLSNDVKNSLMDLYKLLAEVFNKKNINELSANYSDNIEGGVDKPNINHKIIEWVWKFEDWEFIFHSTVKQWEDDEGKYIELQMGQQLVRYHEYYENITWAWYEYNNYDWIFYIWNYTNGRWENHWQAYYANWDVYEWNFKDDLFNWEWTLIYWDWNKFEWIFENGHGVQWNFTFKLNETEEVYDVVLYGQIYKISSWPKKDKFIIYENKYEYNAPLILDEPLNFTPYQIDWIWHIEGNKMFFDNIIEETDESGTFIMVNWKQYYENNMNWLWYRTGFNYYYEWEFENGEYNWEWKTIRANWDIYEWNFKDGLCNWKWTLTYSDWSKYEWEFKDWYFDWRWTYAFANWNKYEWNFKNGKYDWYWILSYSNWDKYEWNFKNDVYDWYWILSYSNWDKYEWNFIDDLFNWEWTLTYNNWLVLNWTFNDWQLTEWTAIISWEKYNVKKDDRWLKVITSWENFNKYIVETTWEFTDWNIDINDDNLKKIFDINNLDIGQANVIQELRDAWMDINMNNITNICKLRDPEKEGELDSEDLDILKVNNEGFGEWYGYSPEEIQAHYNYKRWRIIETIQACVENVIERNEKEISKWEIRNEIRADLVTLPREERLQILLWINEVIKKFNLVNQYLTNYPDPKELLCKIQWITDPDAINAIGEVTVRQHWINFVFFFSDERSFQIAYDKSLIDSGVHAWWWTIPECAIPELNWTLTLINWPDPGEDANNYNYWTIRHEWQHNWNCYFMPDNDNKPIHRAKDEITAYLRDWTWAFEVEKWNNTIEMTLTKPKEHGWLYQYDLQWKDRENHKKQVRELLWYAKDLVELTREPNPKLKREFVISVLADTPAENRKEMHDQIMHAANNGISIDSRDFWRAWTADLQDAENEVNLANSIEELKLILKDPKYSHIPREPDNKWWIEITAMIDKVIAGELSISFIPKKIRKKVEEFLNK